MTERKQQPNGSMVVDHANVWAGGQLLGTDDAQGFLHFDRKDWLGTRRVQTNYQGWPELQCQSLPFGDQLTCAIPQGAAPTADDSTAIHFTGKERDAQSGNDYFDARYYSSAAGRFLSPDDGSDQDPTDPESWNLYSYVRNKPLVTTDANGRCGQTIDEYFDGNHGKTPSAISVTVDPTGCFETALDDFATFNPPNFQVGSYGSQRNVPYRSPDPTNGPDYSQAQVCAASALLHEGGPAFLDAAGTIPAEGSTFKLLQAAFAAISAGVSVSGPSDSLMDPAMSAGTAGLTLVDNAGPKFEATVLGKTLNIVPLLGNATSAAATWRDIKKMKAYYNDCMAGKN